MGENADRGEGLSLRELQLAELSIFKLFKEVCDAHGLRYFAFGGTLLGAIRHKGFIPWDDDMDVAMPRPDFERFSRIVDGHLGDHVVFRTLDSDPTYDRFYGRLEDTSVEVVRAGSNIEESMHAWVDVFPLDGMPSGKAQKIRKAEILAIRALVSLSTGGYNPNKKRPWYERALIGASNALPFDRVLNTRSLVKRLERVAKKSSYDDSDFFAFAVSVYRWRELFEKSMFGDGVDYEFEDTVVRGAVDADGVLTQVYGDWRKLPDEKSRHSHKLLSIRRVS